eukprot:8824472-Lingulodinium_polyedra.AAC.1
MGLDGYALQEHHITDAEVYAATGWEDVVDLIHRQTLVWLGHVARMPVSRLPKRALFGWVAGTLGRQAGVGVLQPRFVQDVLEGAGVPVVDWFRQAQDRKGWRRMVYGKFPSLVRSAEHEKWLDAWRAGWPLRDAWMEAGVERRPDAPGVLRGWVCPVCDVEFAAGNALAHHYDVTHGVRDPDVVTLISQQCPECKVHFANRDVVRAHQCVARRPMGWRPEPQVFEWGPVVHGPPLPPPEGWLLSTDGSGGEAWEQGGCVKIAGWGVA